jgi:hypothetical protein
MGHPEPSRSGGFCLRSGFPHTAGSPIPQVAQIGVTLLKHLEKLPKPDARQRLRPAFVGT